MEDQNDLRKLFDVWVSSERKAQIVVFFHRNPGVVETVEGLARRLGIHPDALRDDLKDHIDLGVLRERKVGDKTVILYDKSRRGSIEKLIQEYLQRKEASL